MTTLHRRLGALHDRPFRLLWAGQAVSTFGDLLMPVAVAFAVLEVGGSASQIGQVFAASLVTRIALTLVGGVWADRLPRQMVMLGSDLLRAASQGALAVLLVTGRAEHWHLLVGGVVYGGAAAFFNPASTGLVPTVVPAQRLQQANALMAMTRSAAYVVAPATAGVLVGGLGPGWAFAVDAATFVVSALFLARLPLPRAATAGPWRFVRELVEGWTELRARTWAGACIAFFAVFNLAIAFFYVLGPVVSEEELDGAASWGVILAGAGIGSLIGSTLALRLRPRRPLLVALSLPLLTPLQLVALAAAVPVPLLAASALLGLAAVAMGNALWLTTLQERVPRHALSRVTAYDWMGSELFMPLGYVIAGPLAAGLGRDAALLSAGTLLVLAVLAVVSVPSVRMLERRDATALEAPSRAAAV